MLRTGAYILFSPLLCPLDLTIYTINHHFIRDTLRSSWEFGVLGKEHTSSQSISWIEGIKYFCKGPLEGFSWAIWQKRSFRSFGFCIACGYLIILCYRVLFFYRITFLVLIFFFFTPGKTCFQHPRGRLVSRKTTANACKTWLIFLYRRSNLVLYTFFYI
jgi:hypothetical protein